MRQIIISIITSVVVSLAVLYSVNFFFDNSLDSLNKGLGVAIVPDSCQSNGGIVTCSYKQPIRNATTTYCIRETPTATSTLVFVSIDNRTSTGTANTIQIGKSATNNNTSTSTLLATKSVLASERWSLTATSTLDTNDNLLLTPSTATTTKNYIVINGTAGYGSSVPIGSCEFVFRIL